ncbi:MAG: alpha/beta fold hydrolase [Solirubrobacteraceae bacterium]|nr:alpha/beta fold hydrolase [Patulibacter sp.]
MKTSLPVRRARALRRLTLTAIGVAATLPGMAHAAVLGTNGAPTPTLHWGACDSALTDRFPDITDFQCATATVPLDYRNPNGTKIQIALSKLPATGPKQGSVFMNPGGPGARGRGVITLATDNLRQHFDLIGFDPRGTGSTTLPVRCASSADEAASLLNPTFPINPVQEATALTKASQGAKGCGQRTPAGVLAHLSSANTARDLDLLRKAVGDAKLTYFSFSAGSIIGETYAQLFPTTTRALALDSPLDPQKYTTGTTTAEGSQPLDYRMKSYVGTDAAVTSFLTGCVANPATCAFADPTTTTLAKLRAKFNATLARIRANNGVVVAQGTPDEQTLSYQDVIGSIFDDLQFGIFTSQDIAGFLNTVDVASKSATARINSHDLQALIAVLLRNRNKPIDPTVSYNDNFYDAFNAVVCADTTHPTSGSAYQTYGRQADTEVPGFGPFWIYTTSACGSWPVTTDVDRYTGPWTARPTTPILMLGNKLGDTSSNYTNEISAAALTGARLVGVNEYGHTTYNLASQCASDVVDNYLISLTVPPVGKTCNTDFGPFDPTDEAATTEGLQGSGGFARVH